MAIVQEIKAKILELNKQLADIQESCNHPVSCRTYKHKANTGNYDPSSDSYWTEFNCLLCDKFWIEDGSAGVGMEIK